MAITPGKTDASSETEEALRYNDDTRRELAPRLNWSEMRESEHFVQFYETDDFLLDSVSGFTGAGLGAGAACIVIATKAHREGLEERLQANGLNPSAAHVRGKYLTLDAAEKLSQFMVDGWTEPERFAEVVGGQIARAVTARRHVRLFWGKQALLWMQGQQSA